MTFLGPMTSVVQYRAAACFGWQLCAYSFPRSSSYLLFFAATFFLFCILIFLAFCKFLWFLTIFYKNYVHEWMLSSVFAIFAQRSSMNTPNLNKSRQGQANRVPFDKKPKICRNRDNRTVCPLTLTLFSVSKEVNGC